MSTSPIVPCIWLDDQAEAAATLYTSLFPNGRVVATSRYPESADNPSGKPRGSVLTVEFEVAGQRFTALNGGPMFKPSPTVSFFVFVDTAAEATRLHDVLIEGGSALMPLDGYPWSERYAWVQDRFGVSWQIMTSSTPAGAPSIAPCLMFTGKQHGRAEEAIRAYTGIFPKSAVDSIMRYGEGEGGTPGLVSHGRFTLAGQPMVAMDAHASSDMAFDEGLSLQVMCKGQGEVDHFWSRLSEGGEEGPCGWLKDRFGLSWQVVPDTIGAWLTSTDTVARDRAFAAMMKMKKPDVAVLQRAFEGESA